MAICDKISTVGNKLQANLNARGVSCVYGKTSQSKQDLEDMADLITDSNLKGSADYLLSLTASRPFLLEDETTDIIARLVNGLGVPQANKEITIFNNQGGALLLPDNWTVTNGSVSVSGNDITLTATSDTNLFIVDPGLSFEDYNVTFNLQPGVSLYWSVTNGTPSNKLNASVGGRVISLEKKGNTLYRKIGSTQLGAIEEHNGLIAFELSASGSATVQCSSDASLYKGITNIEGKFSLYDVSVSEDTTFTATYSSVSDSVLVELCDFVDYAMTGAKNSSWDNYSSRLTLTIDTIGTTLTKGTSNGYYFVNIGSDTYLFEDYVVEFDVINVTNQCFFYEQGQDTTSQNIINFVNNFATGGHCRIVRESGVVKVYKNGTQIGINVSSIANAPVKLGFRINAHDTETRNFKYANFRLHIL